MSSKAIATFTRIRLDPTMNFRMSFEIMLTDEAFMAVRTLELAVSEMGLDMGFDVFFSAKSLLAFWEKTKPLVVHWVRS